jgi:hypothetical protein
MKHETMTHQTDPESPQPVADDKNLAEITMPDLLAVLLKLPEAERNAAYVDMNCWQWPACLNKYKPAEWDDLDDRQKGEHPTAKAAWDAIHACTTSHGRSEAWWVIALGRTREQHAEWIAKGCLPVSSARARAMTPGEKGQDHESTHR